MKRLRVSSDGTIAGSWAEVDGEILNGVRSIDVRFPTAGSTDVPTVVVTFATAAVDLDIRTTPTPDRWGVDYVCPQCGPDPRGATVHAEDRHGATS